MTNKVQLLSFFLSFVFGILFSLFSHYHYRMVFSLKKIFRYVLTFLFILDISFCYILFMYYVNHGVVHIYFVIVTLIGYCVEKKIHQNVKKYVKFCHGIAHRFHR